MPKMKTNRGAAKRFKRSGSGKIRRHRANTSHIMTKMSAKRKRRLAQSTNVNAKDQPAIERLIPYK